MLAAESGFGGFNRRNRFFQFLELGHVEGAIESAVERAQNRARETGRVVLIAGHKLGARQADARSERELLASFGVVEILAADHHADALANRARLRELGELFEFEEAVARSRVR